MRYIILYLIIAVVQTNTSAQIYSNLGNNTGDNLESFSEDLEASASQLNLSLPELFQDSFKVFTLGLYIHSTKYSDHAQSLINLAINYAEQNSPYYLLIVRISNELGLNKFFNVEIKLPTYDSLNCLSIDHYGVISSQIKENIIEKYKILNYNPNLYYMAEKAGMEYLEEYIENKIICCTTRSMSCSDCISEEDLYNFFIDEGYDIIHPDVLDHSSENNSTNILNQTADMDIQFGEDIINVKDDILPFITKFDSIYSNAKIDLHYYTQSECNNILNIITDNPFYGVNSPYIYVKLFGFNSFLLGNCLAIKVITNLELNENPGTGTLYYINLDNSVNIDAVIDSTKYFLNKATLSSIHLDKLNPNSQCNFGKTDGIVIIAKTKSKVVYYAFGNESICRSIEKNTHDEMVQWYDDDDKMNPERSPNPLIMISTSDLDPWYINWDNVENTNRLNGYLYKKNRLLGFIVLHGTSHLAGFTHDPNDDKHPLGYGYANHADKIIEYIKDYEPKWNFEKIISETLKDHIHVVLKTKERFGLY